jgi:uncharacterized membrane protein YhaH (DUF805 family)
MLGFLFGFNARIGRMHYFLATIALAIVMTGICFAIAGHMLQVAPRAALASSDFRTWPVLGAAALFAGITFMLQSMRFRDIGWDPVCVIPGWIAVLVIDSLIASKFPSLSLDLEQHGTIVGGLANLGLFLALLFWPSGAEEGETSASGAPSRTPDAPTRSRDAPSLATDRIARVASGEFGRRA